MNKDIKKILLSLALFSFSGGFFYNFWELWLAENNMSLSTISTVLSLCSLLAVSIIFLGSNIINPKRLRSFILLLLIIKSVIMFSLFFLYKSNLNIVIKFLIILDYGLDTEIYACFYPLISLVNKDDKLYSARELVYDICYYMGVLIASLSLGLVINKYVVSFNTYVIIASILMFLSVFVLFRVNTKEYVKKQSKKDNTGLLLKLLKNIKGDRISIFYLLYVFCMNVAYYSVMGLILTTMIKEFSFAPQMASNVKLTVGISSVIIAALIMAKFTCKNNYINISIKVLGRLILFLLVVIWPNSITMGIALFYTMILSPSYTHVTDAPYINRFDSGNQLAFANFKEMTGYLSRSLGTFLCGTCLVINYRINFAVAAFAVLIALLFAYQALYLYNKEKRSGKHGRKRLG